MARIAGIVLTVVAVLLSIVLKEENVAQLVGMTFGIAASTFAPVLLMTVWWVRATKQGIIATFIRPDTPSIVRGRAATSRPRLASATTAIHRTRLPLLMKVVLPSDATT